MAPQHKLPSTRLPSFTFSRWWSKYQYRSGQRIEMVSSFRYRNLSPLFENSYSKMMYHAKLYAPMIIGTWGVLKLSDMLDEMYLDSHRAEWP